MLHGTTASDVGSSWLLFAGLVGPSLDQPGENDAADHHENGKEELNGLCERTKRDCEVRHYHPITPCLLSFDRNRTHHARFLVTRNRAIELVVTRGRVRRDRDRNW